MRYPGEPPLQIYDFYNLGIGEPYPVSGIHGMGLGDLLDKVVEYFPDEDAPVEDEDVIKVAIVGKPNAGKSSLINYILGQQRVIVSPVAGTTRDAVDIFHSRDQDKFLFIDTAGMRKRAR